jgi:hypothetical protein
MRFSKKETLLTPAGFVSSSPASTSSSVRAIVSMREVGSLRGALGALDGAVSTGVSVSGEMPLAVSTTSFKSASSVFKAAGTLLIRPL